MSVAVAVMAAAAAVAVAMAVAVAAAVVAAVAAVVALSLLSTTTARCALHGIPVHGASTQHALRLARAIAARAWTARLAQPSPCPCSLAQAWPP